ncbi:MATE family efflux transporter [Brachyspira murdochii]|uniref:MATE family efflux transporter n=1 Tax=Brachyspira murdochii TaxID=84378 RepID=UPI0030069C26
MDILKTDVKKIFFKYLYASFGSALIAAIYSIVDVAMVGQYEGDNGAAALAVFAPIWNIIYSIGMLFGIGGSVLFSKEEVLEIIKNQIFSLLLHSLLYQ